jgi:hypothetical protein
MNLMTQHNMLCCREWWAIYIVYQDEIVGLKTSIHLEKLLFAANPD